MGWFAAFVGLTLPVLAVLFSSQIWAHLHGFTMLRDRMGFDLFSTSFWSYLFPTAHIAERPGSGSLWTVVQYQNFDSTVFSPNSSIQSTLHKLSLGTMLMPADDRVVFTAVHAHSTLATYLGDGWNAGVSGPADIAFDAAGSTAYVVHQYSNDVLICPSTTTSHRPGSAPPLVEIPVGDLPIGIAASPTMTHFQRLSSLRSTSPVGTA